MQFAQLYEDTVFKLGQSGVDDARIDAVLLLEFCFGLTRTRLFLDGAKEVPSQDLERFYAILERRLARQPLHYITGTREFWSLDFIVSPAVLVPRPETEFVLDTVLTTVKQSGYHHGPVLDMCTGSGVIAVILARELAADNVVAVDISVEALLVAARNIHKFALENTIALVCSDLFTAVRESARYEVIVVNPPYIAEAAIAGLEPEVRDWEPRAALSGGLEGWEVIEKIAAQAYRYLVPGGWLFIEIGSDQGERVKGLFTRHTSKQYEHIAVVPDWSGRSRLLQARRKGNM